MLSLRLESRLDELQRLEAAVEDLGEREQWPPSLLYQVKLVLEEVIVNIVNYGYEGGGHKIDVDLISEPDTLTIKIADDGRAFDPLTQAPTPDVGASLEDRPIGGLGVYLVQTLMDEAHYRREQDRNHLTLVKRRDG